jgi:hypothetical protein
MFYVQRIQGHSQPRLSTADQAPSFAAYATYVTTARFDTSNLVFFKTTSYTVSKRI